MISKARELAVADIEKQRQPHLRAAQYLLPMLLPSKRLTVFFPDPQALLHKTFTNTGD